MVYIYECNSTDIDPLSVDCGFTIGSVNLTIDISVYAQTYYHNTPVWMVAVPSGQKGESGDLLYIYDFYGN